MKKTIKLALMIIIFAGFSTIPFNLASAQSGTSADECKQKKVKLITYGNEDADGNKQRVWEECSENGLGCKQRFCNESSEGVTEDDKPFWKQKSCNKYCVTFQEAIPIGNKEVRSISGESGTDLAMNYVSMIYKFGAAILGIVAILVIVVSGVQMMAGGADEGNVTSAKDRILQAILSLVLLFSSALILRTINPDFFT